MDMWVCMGSTIALPVLSLLVFWSIHSSRKKQMKQLFEHIDAQLGVTSNALLQRQRADTHAFEYDARPWVIKVTPPTEYAPYRVNVTTSAVKLPSWCAIEIDVQGALRFEVQQQPLDVDDPQQVRFPPMAALFALGRFGGGGVARFLKLYPEHLNVEMPASSLDEAGREVVLLLRALSSLLDTLEDQIPDSLRSFWLTVCAQNAVETALVRQALGALVALYANDPEVRALWLDRLPQMDHAHTMTLVQRAPIWAQAAFFEQPLSHLQWLDYAQASLSLRSPPKMLQRCMDLACGQMTPEDLRSLGDGYQSLYGELFAWFWSEASASVLMNVAATWWPLMSTARWFENVKCVMACSPKLVDDVMFDGVSERLKALSSNERATLAQLFAQWINHRSRWSVVSSEVLAQLMPYFERGSAQMIYDLFVEHATPQHYGPIFGAISAHKKRAQPPAVSLFRAWYASIKDDPKIAGALSVSMDSGLTGALSSSAGDHEGALSMSGKE